MKNKKKQIIAIGVLLVLIICIGTLAARAAIIDGRINEKKEQAEQMLDYYHDILVSRLMYELNTAGDIALKISQNVENTELFKKAAAESMQNGGISYAALIKGKKVLCALPEAEYENQVGLEVGEFPYVFNMPSLLKDTVIEGPKDFFEDGHDTFLYLEPLFQDEKYWGEVAICLNKDLVLNVLDLESLSKQGYEYELWKIDFQDGHKETIAVSDGLFDFSQGASIQFNMTGQWTLNIMPKAGWVGKTDSRIITAGCMILGLLLMGIVILSLRIFWLRKSKYMQAYEDGQSHMLNRAGLEQEIHRWITEKNGAFTIIYLVVQGYNEVSQLLGAAGQKAYLERAEEGIHNLVENKHVIGRVGEANFCVAVLDDMNEREASDLAKSLCVELIWKRKSNGKKEFLNVGYQCVLYPKDGTNERELVEKAIHRYFSENKNNIV